MTQRYDKYKDSGVQWLGEIPGHWNLTRLKYLSDKIGDGLHGTPEFAINGKYYFINGNNLGSSSIQINKRTNAVDEEEFNKYRVNLTCNTILISLNGTIGNTSFYEGQSIILGKSAGYINLRQGKNKKYIRYYLSGNVLPKFLLAKLTGTTIQNLSLETLRNTPVVFPPLPEQHAIVSYLDDKCGKIDEWIEKKQKEVELLGELKQRVIADAVTRGLNPNVKMKQTNIPWLPELPEHWEVKSLRNFLTMFAEKRHGDKQLLSVTREQGVIVRNTDSKEENHNFIPEDLSNYKYVQEGDFVINKMKSWQGSYGVSEHEGIVSPAYFTCRLSGVDKTFFSTAIRSKVYISFFGRYSKGIRVDQWDLSPIGLKSIPFLLPPLEEQKQIVAYITDKTFKIDKLITNINKEIDGIKEYKQRLISDVVTGQIKVC